MLKRTKLAGIRHPRPASATRLPDAQAASA